jgi:hypothetical protein
MIRLVAAQMIRLLGPGRPDSCGHPASLMINQTPGRPANLMIRLLAARPV